MEFEIETSALREAVQKASLGIARGDSIPIFQSLLIAASRDGTVTLEACDGDRGIRITCDAADVPTAGGLAVPATDLGGVLKSLPAGSQVGLSAQGDGGLRIRCGSSRWRLGVLPEEDFPSFFETGEAFVWSAESERFMAALARLAPLQSDEETRYYLCCTHLRRARNGEGLLLEATDGKVLGGLHVDWRVTNAGSEAISAADPRALLPRDTVAVALRLFKGAAVSLRGNASRLTLAAGRVELVTKLIDGTFPDVDTSVLAQDEAAMCRFLLRRDDLAEALAQVRPVSMTDVSADKREALVWWRARSDGLLLLGQSEDRTGLALCPIASDAASFEDQRYSVSLLDRVLTASLGAELTIEVERAAITGAAPSRFLGSAMDERDFLAVARVRTTANQFPDRALAELLPSDGPPAEMPASGAPAGETEAAQ